MITLKERNIWALKNNSQSFTSKLPLPRQYQQYQLKISAIRGIISAKLLHTLINISNMPFFNIQPSIHIYWSFVINPKMPAVLQSSDYLKTHLRYDGRPHFKTQQLTEVKSRELEKIQNLRIDACYEDTPANIC